MAVRLILYLYGTCTDHFTDYVIEIPGPEEQRFYFGQESMNERKSVCAYVCGAGKSKERKGQGYNNNDIQVHLGACLDFIAALFKCIIAPFFPDQPFCYPSDLCNRM